MVSFPKVSVIFYSVLGVFCALTVMAAEPEKKLDGISVVGNNEDPRVLYLVPWQPPSISKKAEHEPTTVLPDTIGLLNPKLTQQLMHFRATHQFDVQTLQNH